MATICAIWAGMRGVYIIAEGTGGGGGSTCRHQLRDLGGDERGIYNS